MLTPEEWTALTLSLRVAGWATLWGLIAATAFAWLLARHRFPGRVLLDALLHAPLILPPVVTGFALLLVFGIEGPVGRWLDAAWGVRLAFTPAGAALAAGVCAFPLMLRAARQAIEAVDPALEEAARSLGAGPVDRALTIVLPLAAPGLLAAAVVGFAAALGEFGAVITFAASIPGETQTLPLAIYAALQVPGGEGAALRLSAISLAAALAGLLLSELLLAIGRRRAAR
ncbi:molybdate ABC transporter permease subunit [Sphingomonas sp. KR1UV-12]|uniref:Molybdenum transport system permease n=1 Tax=Sphingomonas aurea TaxID=3063994 RepID=A0ABT9EMI4_9SPHN|nr:molybdate ABC transporter permease subunit [Sphingomonas sp. KR1UV-12]MDP1028169.1 molybdate ABC transporter permease subunit [Sphingomonas sp. KR1UV-12]